MVSNIKTPITLSLFTFQSVSQILVICAYRKIPKMSPSLYKPLQNKYKPPKLITQKTLRYIALPNISPLGDCT